MLISVIVIVTVVGCGAFHVPVRWLDRDWVWGRRSYLTRPWSPVFKQNDLIYLNILDQIYGPLDLNQVYASHYNHKMNAIPHDDDEVVVIEKVSPEKESPMSKAMRRDFNNTTSVSDKKRINPTQVGSTMEPSAKKACCEGCEQGHSCEGSSMAALKPQPDIPIAKKLVEGVYNNMRHMNDIQLQILRQLKNLEASLDGYICDDVAVSGVPSEIVTHKTTPKET